MENYGGNYSNNRFNAVRHMHMAFASALVAAGWHVSYVYYAGMCTRPSEPRPRRDVAVSYAVRFASCFAKYCASEMY